LRNDYRMKPQHKKERFFTELIPAKLLQKRHKNLLSLLTKQQTRKHTLFRISSLVYLVFLIVSLSVSPTTAHFTDKTTLDGSISMAESFDGEEQKEKDKSNQANEESGEDTSTSDDDSKGEEQEQTEEVQKEGDRNSSSDSAKAPKQEAEKEANPAEDKEASTQAETEDDETENKSDIRGEDDDESER